MIKRLGHSGLGRFFGEFNPGDVQRRIRTSPEVILNFPYVFSAVTQIAQDIGKMGLELVERVDGVDRVVTRGGPAVTSALEVIRKPNRLQVLKKFVESWVYSLYLSGETIVLKGRDRQSNFVNGLYVLDTWRASANMTPDGRVLYDLSSDNIAGMPARVGVPQSEIIHHVINAMYHPLWGVSPLDPLSLAVSHGLAIQSSQYEFFINGAKPGGILTAEGEITDDEHDVLREEWNQSFTGDMAGNVAILGHGMAFHQMQMTAKDATVKDQLDLTAEMVASVMHMPIWLMKGMAPPPGHKPSDLFTLYYSQCLQSPIEGIEAMLDDAFGLPDTYHFRFRIADLTRMDPRTQMETINVGVGGKFVTLNEARAQIGLPPVKGGDRPWMQMQDVPIEMLLMMQQQIADQGGVPGDPLKHFSEDDQRAAISAVQKWLQ